MNSTDLIFAGIVLGLALIACIIVIIAALLIATTKWHRCPLCGLYHNQTGDTVSFPPYGRSVGTALCADCQKKD